VDLESVTADISAAADTARANEAKIAQSREILGRARDVLDRIRRRTNADPESLSV
jgi:hypothetical protein